MFNPFLISFCIAILKEENKIKKLYCIVFFFYVSRNNKYNNNNFSNKSNRNDIFLLAIYLAVFHCDIEQMSLVEENLIFLFFFTKDHSNNQSDYVS